MKKGNVVIFPLLLSACMLGGCAGNTDNVETFSVSSNTDESSVVSESSETETTLPEEESSEKSESSAENSETQSSAQSSQESKPESSVLESSTEKKPTESSISQKKETSNIPKEVSKSPEQQPTQQVIIIQQEVPAESSPEPAPVPEPTPELVPTPQPSETNITACSKFQEYNGKIYYVSKFEHQNLTGNIDMSYFGSQYVPLPVFAERIQTDFFVIHNDVIYFADEESGSAMDYFPAKLYKCNLDGSGLTLIASEIKYNFILDGDIIKYEAFGSDMFYCYNTLDGTISTGTYPDIFTFYIFQPSIFSKEQDFGIQNAITFRGGNYYKDHMNSVQANIAYYRTDTRTNEQVMIGTGFTPQG